MMSLDTINLKPTLILLKNKNKRLSQNKLEMASVVSFQIEVIWISLKR